MLRLLNLIFLITLCLGLGIRASGLSVAHCENRGCCEMKDYNDSSDTDPANGPLDHDHHHGECCTASAWGELKSGELLVFLSWQSSPRALSANEYPPEGPVLPLDKPPII